MPADADWSLLSDETQLALADDALQMARARIARQADTLAEAMLAGDLPDRGGADALRLMAALLRTDPLAFCQPAHAAWPAGLSPAGHA